MTNSRRRREGLQPAARKAVTDVWEVVAEAVSQDGNNDAALRQIMADHPELRELPSEEVRIDILCGRSSSSVRVLRRVA